MIANINGQIIDLKKYRDQIRKIKIKDDIKFLLLKFVILPKALRIINFLYPHTE